MKRLITVILFCLVAFNSEAAKYFKSGATTWNTANNWSATSSSGSDNAGIPTSSDAVIFDAGSGTCSLATTTGVCASIDFTNYTHTITFTVGLTCSGNITLGASMGIAGGSTVTINGNSTLTSNGKVLSTPFSTTGTVTLTIAGGNNWICSSVISLNTNCTLNTTTTEKFEIRGSSNQNVVANCTGTATLYFTGFNNIQNSTTTNNIIFDCGVNTLTIVSGQTLNFKTGTITYTSGTITTTGSTLVLQGNCTISTNGMSWATVNLNPSPSLTNFTVTLNSLFSANTIANVNNMTSYAITFAGSSGFTVGALSYTNSLGTLILTYGNTYTVTSSFICATSPPTAHFLLKSSSAGNKVVLTLTNGATCSVGYLDFTDVDNSLGRTINTFKGTLSNTNNINSYTDCCYTIGTN